MASAVALTSPSTLSSPPAPFPTALRSVPGPLSLDHQAVLTTITTTITPAAGLPAFLSRDRSQSRSPAAAPASRTESALTLML